MNISLKQLRIFLEVARHQSMARAATALNLTASGISTRIKEIETELGFSLFDRNSRHLSLSVAGEYFLTYARRIIADVREAEIAVARFKRLERGLLTVGIGRTAEYFVPEMLAQFHQKYPDIDIKIRTSSSREDIVQSMEDAEVDLSIMELPPKELTALTIAFASNPYLFVCSPKHPAAANARISDTALKDYGLMVREEGSGARAAMEAFFSHLGCSPKIAMEIPTNQTIKHSVIAGLGVGFLSLHTIGLELTNGLLIALDIEGTPVLHTWNLVHLQSKQLSPAAEAFHNFVLKQGADRLRSDTNTLLAKTLKKRRKHGTIRF